jgi:hypothetical protein
MTREDEYRRNAADTVDLAHRAGTSSDKGRLLALAEKWLDLAERAHRIASRTIGRPAQQDFSAAGSLGNVRPEVD